jgi:hypothetical protein
MLLISYHFPPSAAVGGRRLANFARSLVAAGWRPTVLTIRDEDAQRLDVGLVRDLDSVAIHKTAVWPTVDRAYAATRKRLRGASRDAVASPSAASSTPATTPGKESLRARLRRYVLSFLMLPDPERGWIIPATAKATRIVRKHRIGWILTSCPPYSVHIIGLLVKSLTGARWVAGFRDPWMTTGSKQLYPTCAASLRIEGWLERKVVERADLLLFSVARLRDAYRERYHDVAPEKFIYVRNAVAPPTEAATAIAKYERFTLSYTGVLYLGRSPEPIFKAIAQLITDGKTTTDAIRIKLVGHCRTIDGAPTMSVAQRYGLEAAVEVIDAVPHQDAQDIIARSHLALLFAPNLPFQIPAKVYDYLGAGTRILAIAEDGGTADIIRETQSGEAFASDDIGGIARFIVHEMDAARSPERLPSTLLSPFEFKRVTEDLVGHLTRAAATGVIVAR